MKPKAKLFLKCLPLPDRRVFRLPAAVLCIFLLTASPVLADPVTIHQVVQTLTSSQGTLDLRLKSMVAQDPVKGPQQSGLRNDTQQTQSQGGTKSDSVAPGVTVTDGQQIGVEAITDGEVEGSICDCGDIPPIIAGGFPKWPFFLLGAIPLAFIDTDNEEKPTPTPTPIPSPTQFSLPTPTPTPTPAVPEPASLFLLGTGLAAACAGLRRRRANTKTAEQTETEGGE
jgi:hypothetical protein